MCAGRWQYQEWQRLECPKTRREGLWRSASQGWRHHCAASGSDCELPLNFGNCQISSMPTLKDEDRQERAQCWQVRSCKISRFSKVLALIPLAGSKIKAGKILLQVHPGSGVGKGKDFTLYALQAGIVVFQKNKYIKKVRSGVLACSHGNT